MITRIMTHVHSHCTAHYVLSFSDVPVVVVVRPVHTYPDIFESATFCFRIQTFPRLHVAKISGFATEFAECVRTEAVSGKKKLRIKKFPQL